MAKIITAVEIHRDGVEAIELSVHRRGVKLIRFINEPIDGDTLTPDGLSLFFNEHRLNKEEVVTSVPGDMLITRQIAVPFREKKKIDSVLAYEVEPLVPFPIDELDICYRILEQEKGRSELLVYALPKGLLDTRVKLFEDAAIPLQMVTVSSLSAANTLFQTDKIPRDRLSLHLHILADFSILSIYNMGILSHFTKLSWGARNLFENLRQVTGLDPDTLSDQLRSITPRQEEEVLNALQGAEENLVSQIRRQVDLFLLQSQSSSPDHINVTGPYPALRLLLPLITKSLAVRAEIADPLLSFPNNIEKTAYLHGIHAPLGAALMQGGKDTLTTMFRRKEQTLWLKLVQSKQQLRYAMVVLLVLFFGFMADFFVGLQAREYHYQQIEKEMQRLFQDTFPGVENVGNELEHMKLKIKDLEKQNEIFESVFGEKPSALEILNELNIRIPEKIELGITDFTLDTKSIRFVGWTDSFNSVNLIEKELKTSELLGDVKVSNAKIGKDKNKVNFQIMISFRK